MKRNKKLDDLLGPMEPTASFHDARILSAFIDYVRRTAMVEFEICVGDPEASDLSLRERCRRGRLIVSGLMFWSIEHTTAVSSFGDGPPWLTSDGLLDEAPTNEGKQLAKKVGNIDVIAWYLYFSDLNSFGYCIAQDARFDWL